MKKFKQFLRKYKWYRWCKENSVKAHILLSVAISLSMWVFLLKNPIDIAILYSFIVLVTASLLKETWDVLKPNPTGFSAVDLFINFWSWVIGTIVSAVIYAIGFSILN